MGTYLRLLGALAQNLARRLGEDLADCAAGCKRGLDYKLRSFRERYDDVGPGGSLHFEAQPEQLAELVESVRSKPWFCQMDRRTAQDLVHDGGAGCFLIRPSASTKSLTLTLWYHQRPYNILIRCREDGLLALGSKKNQEMTFQSVEEMVCYYEREPLILYSGGEMTGRTRLKAPPPGLVRGKSPSTASGSTQPPDSGTGESRRGSSQTVRRPSEEVHSPPGVCSRTLSSGNANVPFASSNNSSVNSDAFGASLNNIRRAPAKTPDTIEEINDPTKNICGRTLPTGNNDVPFSPPPIIDRIPSAEESIEDIKDTQHPPVACSRTLSSGSSDAPFSPSISTRLTVSTPNMEHTKVFPLWNSPRRLSAETLGERANRGQPLPMLIPRPSHSGMKFEEIRKRSAPSYLREASKNPPISKRPLPPLPTVHQKVVPSLSLSVANSSSSESSCL